ncbi:hypothetical protein [Colwellia sp. Arc7-D]|uniref:hypothetical protein n=1 Tax=Colwellia sp. Arc7-D TaxID=2161872 RepID=UPI000D3A1340|nr:hypothetical protein [Colwellia sp. Arc7-D]AWB57839.1 hypothetical protein DBO93_09825 [Colwellia sp. Arc7-D]
MNFFTNVFKSKEQKLREKRSELIRQKDLLKEENLKKILAKQKGIPLYRARHKLDETLVSFETRRDELNQLWENAYKDFSWWNKLKHGEKLDLRGLDTQISQLKSAIKKFTEVYGADCQALHDHFNLLKLTSEKRIDFTYRQLLKATQTDLVKDVNDSSMGMAWLASLSVPVSIADDLISASEVYGSLKAVNGNFENMSNSDIWWETLWMSPESHAGLVSLTKGAYFEQLVADNTNGQLHEHFNNPDTDILIGGTEMQIKATDNIAYINSVDDDIPVIATSEVALATGVIDGGYSNEDITNSVEHALGGTVIDAKDTAVDLVLTGVASLGIFASLNGINHASKQYDKGVDGVQSFFEGAGVAIEGTAKGLVDASELVYKVVMSKPIRFVGRTLIKGIKILDETLFVEQSKEGKK